VNGTFRDYVAVRADMLYVLPDGMSFELGALIEPAAVAVHGVGMAGDIRGKTGLILGAGPIGLITMLAYKAAGGGRVLCVDINDTRLSRAKDLGADEALNNLERPDLANVCDIAFETAGSPVTTAQLFTAVRPGGCAVQIGWPAGSVVQMNIADFMVKEITYRGLNRYANAYPAAIAWLADGRIPGEKLITHRMPFERTAEAFAFTAEHPDQIIKMMVLAGEH